MELNPLAIIGLGISVFTLIGLVGVYFREISGIKTGLSDTRGEIKRIDERVECVPQMHEEVTRLRTSMDIYGRLLEDKSAKVIHSPTHKRRDDLVDLFVERKLGVSELKELRRYLAVVEAREPEDSQKHAAAFLLREQVEHRLDRLERRSA